MIKKLNNAQKNLIFYILKCVTGCAVLFSLSKFINSPDANWAIISALLVLSPNNEEALPFAITRIKANIVGGFASLLCLLILPPGIITICISIVITICTCFLLRIMQGSRAAVAAVIIVMVHDMSLSPSHFWSTTIYRIGFVIFGCLFGLLITFIFHRRLRPEGRPLSKPEN